MNRALSMLFLCLVVSCTTRLQQALEFAGDNRCELEKVLEHYSAVGDEEKLRAAEYLIMNMPGHECMTGDYEGYYDAVDSLFLSGISSEEAFMGLPALSARYADRISFGYDSRVIDAEYLIRDIDLAFSQWRNGEWARHLEFEEFCEWLLPYSCGQKHPLDNWREDLEPVAKGYMDDLRICEDFKGAPRAAISRVNDGLRATIKGQRWRSDFYGYRIYRPETFARLPSATCEDYCESATRVMRSKGIPSGIDFTPQWPDRNAGHYWCVFPDLRGKTTLFSPYASRPGYPHYDQCAFAKVFRRTYSPNAEYMDLLRRAGRYPVAGICPDVFFKDVTHEYVRTSDVEVELFKNMRPDRGVAYIAVFDNTKWQPVCWGYVKRGKARFRAMGRNVTYIVLGYIDGKLVPQSNPFYVGFNGEAREIVPDFSKETDIELTRKYPVFQHVFQVHERMKDDGYIEASNERDFSKSRMILNLPEWFRNSGRVLLTDDFGAYRYWRLCVEDGKVCDMAELFFRDAEEKMIKPLTVNTLVDGDPLTNYRAEGDDLLEVVDFGAPVSLREIMYVRRGDGNEIIPGDVYEIYYWDDSKWNLHASVRANDICLNISGLPSGALYYIKGLSRGKQNRIFTWDDGKSEIIWH